MDPYSVLGVEKTATQEEIKSAYRKKAMETHPDRNPGNEQAAQQFKEINNAYEILDDPEKKARYDSTGSTTTTPRGHAGDGFSSGPFWSFFGDAPPTDPHERGRNIHFNLELDLIDVLNGTTKKITIPKRERCIGCEGAGYKEFKGCTVCHGSGKVAKKVPGFNIYSSCGACKGTGRAGTVPCDTCKGEGCVSTGEKELELKIPPGVETGNQSRITGHGEPARNPFGKNGDLIIVIIVKSHKLFARQNGNLFLELPVGFADLVLGTKVEVPTLTGVATLSIPPRTQDLTQFRLKGMGLPYVGTGGKGDLLITVTLAVPPKNKVTDLKYWLEGLQKVEAEYLTELRNKFKGE